MARLSEEISVLRFELEEVQKSADDATEKLKEERDHAEKEKQAQAATATESRKVAKKGKGKKKWCVCWNTRGATKRSTSYELSNNNSSSSLRPSAHC